MKARWSPTGDELYFVHDDKEFMSVSVKTQPSLVVGAPKRLFSGPWEYGYDVSSDGARFLLVRNVGDLENPNLAVVQNWFAEFSADR